jgi:RNA polymerase sigma factor (sigma-70 family)
VTDANPNDYSRDGASPGGTRPPGASTAVGDHADRAQVDRLLVERALKGDGAAWNAIVERYGALAFGTARRAGLDRDEAEDVMQAVFTSLVRSLGTLRDSGALASWIATSARRAAWRAARRARATRTGADLEQAATGVDLFAADAALERRVLVERALGAIDDRCGALLQALFLSAREPDYTSLAARFGIALNSVGPIRNRCLRRLLEALEALGFEPSSLGISSNNGARHRTDAPPTGS